MSGWTYTTMSSALQNWVENSDTTFLAEIDRIIEQATQWLDRDLDVMGKIVHDTSKATTGSNAFVTLASSIRLPKTVELVTAASGARFPLIRKGYDFIAEFWPNRTTTGTPRFYSIYEDLATAGAIKLIMAPTPNAVWTVDVAGETNLVPISTGAPTNWYTAYAGNAYFAAARYFAAVYEQDMELVAQAKEQYAEEIARLGNFARRRRRDDHKPPKSPDPGTNTLVEGAH